MRRSRPHGRAHNKAAKGAVRRKHPARRPRNRGPDQVLQSCRMRLGHRPLQRVAFRWRLRQVNAAAWRVCSNINSRCRAACPDMSRREAVASDIPVAATGLPCRCRPDPLAGGAMYHSLGLVVYRPHSEPSHSRGPQTAVRGWNLERRCGCRKAGNARGLWHKIQYCLSSRSRGHKSACVYPKHERIE